MQYILSIIIFILGVLTPAHFTETINQENFTPDQLEQAKKLIEKYTQEDIASLDSELIYKQNCSACHGRKGGLGLAGASNLKKSTFSLEERVATLYFGLNKMQSYKDAMSEKELVAVAGYLEGLRK